MLLAKSGNWDLRDLKRLSSGKVKVGFAARERECDYTYIRAPHPDGPDADFVLLSVGDRGAKFDNQTAGCTWTFRNADEVLVKMDSGAIWARLAARKATVTTQESEKVLTNSWALFALRAMIGGTRGTEIVGLVIPPSVVNDNVVTNPERIYRPTQVAPSPIFAVDPRHAIQNYEWTTGNKDVHGRPDARERSGVKENANVQDDTDFLAEVLKVVDAVLAQEGAPPR